MSALLLGGRLLSYEDKSFKYLKELVNPECSDVLPRVSPLGWTDDDRTQLVYWAQATFDDERLEFGERARPRTGNDAIAPFSGNDRRSELREAALAIGSETVGSGGIRADDPLALRAMLAWFWSAGTPAIIIAPCAKLGKANLAGADLREAKLGKANLAGADLRWANLRWADLQEADLQEADFKEADLREANFHKANASKADLREVDAREANFSDANPQEAKLGNANFFKANLNNAKLGDADLRRIGLCGAELEGAKLGGADLRDADLRSARFRNADLRNADLHNADLRNADLRNANLREADLRGADLRETKLGRAFFPGADLRGADARGASFGNANPRRVSDGLRSVRCDEATKWPDGFDPPNVGNSSEDPPLPEDGR